MTTGPAHYAEAERLARLAIEDRDYPETSYAVLAQVHATLALAAATAMSHWNSYALPMPQPDRLAWEQAASEQPAALARSREAEQAELAENAEYEASTAAWFAESRAAGCTGTGYDTGRDTIEHKGVLPCPVHPGL